ncbi:MAG TPA: type IV pilin [Methanocorpusculum sp.]|nr:type IV pilin [Methanocorpusculum sp.]
MNRRLSEKCNDGVSPVVATLLLLIITVILCAIIAAFCTSFINWMEQPVNKTPPEILAIISVDHYNNGTKTFAGKVTLKNIGIKSLCNSNYSAEVYIDDIKQFVIIKTLQAHDFIPTEHYGICIISGCGPRGYEWGPGSSGLFDLKDGMVQPGALLRIDIIRKEDGVVISRSIKKIE